MAPTQRLLHMVLLALCWRSSVTEAQDTVPLQTLKCYNDYTSRIICSWADTEDAQGIINLTLYRRLDKDEAVSCDVSKELLWSDCPSPHRCAPRRCVIPYNLFVVADEDFYSFQLDRDLGVQLTVPLTQHVQPPPPTDIQVSPSGDHFLLNWTVPLGDTHVPWLSPEDMAFEVAYRRLQDPWEDAAKLYTNNSWATLKSQLLLPSSTYVARVRTRLSPGSRLSGRPSQWSPEVHWDSQPGDVAQPQNLQCFFDGARTLSCSWEVRTRLNGSVSFGLFYSPSPAAREEECSPVEEQLAGLFIRYRCGINVSNPSAHSLYAVSVRPRKQGKFIQSSNHIQLPPPILSLTKDGDRYSLHWEKKKTIHANKFQVQYRRDLDTWKDSKTETLQHVHSMALPALEPATTYRARVRVMPIPGGYQGIWSEWSKENSWTTELALPTWGMTLLAVLVTFTLLTALRFGGVYGYRLNKRWKEKIPNPRKCMLFRDRTGGPWPPSSTVAFSRGSYRLQEPRSGIFTTPDRVSSIHLEVSEVSPVTIEDPNIIQDPPSGPDITPAALSEPMEQFPDPQLDPSISSSRLENQIPSFNFNGPYLGPPHSHSLLGLEGQPVPPLMGRSLKPALPGSLEYLCLPPGGQVQLVPLAQVLEQGQAVDVECGPGLGPQRTLPMEGEDIPVPPDSEPKVRQPDLEETPEAPPVSSGSPKDPMVISDYITHAEMVLTVPVGTAPSVSLAPSLGFPAAPNPSLCPRLSGGPLESSTSRATWFEGYVELPSSMSQLPVSSLGNPALPVPSSPVVNLGAPSKEVVLACPHPECLIILQQVGDYCQLPRTGLCPLPPQAKPSFPGWEQSSN